MLTCRQSESQKVVFFTVKRKLVFFLPFFFFSLKKNSNNYPNPTINFVSRFKFIA